MRPVPMNPIFMKKSPYWSWPRTHSISRDT
jgi:hypothetical protein